MTLSKNPGGTNRVQLDQFREVILICPDFIYTETSKNIKPYILKMVPVYYRKNVKSNTCSMPNRS